MSEEPPAKKGRLEDGQTSSSCSPPASPSNSPSRDEEVPHSPSNPYSGSCRAYGGSDHLPVDDQHHGFQLLDEVNEDDDDSELGTSSDDDDVSLASCDVPDDEVHQLLEDGMPGSTAPPNKDQRGEDDVEGKKRKRAAQDPNHCTEVEKHFLVDVDLLYSHFDKLPAGWMQMMHNSGMPVYLHKASRVCTMTRPYYLGMGSTKKHDVPLTAIPCLHYKRMKEKRDEANRRSNKAEASTSNVSSSSDKSNAAEHPDPVVAEVTETGSANASGSCTSDGPISLASDPTGAVCSVTGTSIVTEAAVTTSPATATASSCPYLAKSLQDKGPLLKTVGQLSKEADMSNQIKVPMQRNDRGNSSIVKNELSNQSGLENNNRSSVASTECVTADQTEETSVKIENDESACTVNSSDCDNNAGVTPASASSTTGQSSTYNVALAKALNILPAATPPPGGLLPGLGEVYLEQPVLHLLTPEELREYCLSRFQFKIVKRLSFNNWMARRAYEKIQRSKRMPLPEGTQLLTLKPNSSMDEQIAYKKKRWLLNPKGKSSICILHEYVQFMLKKQPVYKFKEMPNASSPYAAAIVIKDMEYATGFGSSKKIAKSEAARATLEILMPELAHKLNKQEGKQEDADLAFFDKISIEDPNVPELCNKMSELPPYSLLLNCLQRNYCLTSTNVTSSLITNVRQKNEFMMSVGKHTVKVPCKNKKEGKQKASQALLQMLHPHISSWGSMLRLYGSRSVQLLRRKKKEEQEVTLLQNNATVNQPNYSIINMLKSEMLKLHKERSSVKLLGEFKPPENITLPQASSTNLNTLDI